MKGTKKTRVGADVSGQKKAVIEEKPESFLTKNPVWAFSFMDRDHPRWSFSDDDKLYSKILCKLASYEGMTWQAISSTKGSKKDGHGSESHFISIDGIIREAQKRLEELHQSDVGELFSLRLNSTERLWGILTDGTFRVLWYDRNHEISK